MVSRQQVEAQLRDRQQAYVAFMCDHLQGWRAWAQASDRMERGEAVAREEVEPFFQTEYEWMRIALEMQARGAFDWNDPRLGKLFAAAAQTEFYRFWGDQITAIALEMADLVGAGSLLEVGAGRGNLTATMLQKLTDRGSALPVVLTDAHETLIDQQPRLAATYPEVPLQAQLWNFCEPPPAPLRDALSRPVVAYERASITYATVCALEHLAAVADVVVLGDYFNYTGEQFGYDRISARVGIKPLMYADARPLLEQLFTQVWEFDREATELLGVPNISLVIAWRDSV